MTHQTNPDYRRMFWQIARQYLAHHGLLILARRYNSPRLVARLDRQVRKKLNYTNTSTFPVAAIQEYVSVAEKASLWHGTGRLQYVDGVITDTLAAIVQSGFLAPARDVYSIALTGKEMQSISATTQRIIARSYADRHGQGMQEPDRYGSSLWWAAYYYNLCYVELVVKHGLTARKNKAAFNRASTNAQGERTWGKKVNTQAKSVWDTFGLGSDIVGNYPVVFGIKNTTHLAVLPKTMQKWEARITEPIPLEAMSHIEAPAQKVEEVQELLRRHGHNVPVFPIELGEYVASRQSLADLLHSK